MSDVVFASSHLTMSSSSRFAVCDNLLPKKKKIEQEDEKKPGETKFSPLTELCLGDIFVSVVFLLCFCSFFFSYTGCYLPFSSSSLSWEECVRMFFCHFFVCSKKKYIKNHFRLKQMMILFCTVDTHVFAAAVILWSGEKIVQLHDGENLLTFL